MHLPLEKFKQKAGSKLEFGFQDGTQGLAHFQNLLLTGTDFKISSWKDISMLQQKSQEKALAYTPLDSFNYNRPLLN